MIFIENNILASGSLDKTVKLWDLDANEEIATFRKHDDFINAIAYNRINGFLASASSDRTIKLIDINSEIRKTKEKK